MRSGEIRGATALLLSKKAYFASFPEFPDQSANSTHILHLSFVRYAPGEACAVAHRALQIENGGLGTRPARAVIVRCDPDGICAIVAVNSERAFLTQIFYVSLITGAGILAPFSHCARSDPASC